MGVSAMLKVSRLFAWLVIVMVVACGSMTIRVDSEVSDETDIKHNVQIEASGQIALTLAEQFASDDSDDFDQNCESDIDTHNENFSIICDNISQEILSEGEVEGQGLLVTVEKSDLGDQWEYRAVMTNIFFAIEEELEDNPFVDSETLDAIVRLRFHWTVEMPGDVVETNADISENKTASFNVRLGDEREIFEVVSRQDKPGSCN